MAGFTVWHGLAIGLLIGIVGLTIWLAHRADSREDDQVSGFGGWFVVVVLIQTLAPLRTFSTLVIDLRTYETAIDTPGGKIAICGEVVLMLVLLGIQLATTVLMYRRSHFFGTGSHFRRLP